MMKEAISIDIRINKKDWAISAKDLIANIEMFSYNRNRLIEYSQSKILPPTTYIKNAGFSSKSNLMV